MSKIVYNAESLKVMTLFENVTRVRVKDYFLDDNELMNFVVDEVMLGKAIGKQAANVKKLEAMFKKKIKIVGFNPSPRKFLKNLLYPLQVEVEGEEEILMVKANDQKTKSFVIGRNQANLKNNLEILKKYFKINEIKVI
jgi:NusA-like KH domain protein